MWLLDRLRPGGSEYNESFAAELTGELRVEALRSALNAIVRRHDVLRARFVLVDQSPMQVIEPELVVALEVEDLRALPEDARRAEALRRASEEALAPFDLSTGPLLRARLLRLDERTHWLLLTLHHIVTDGWSSAVLARELSALYGAHCRGEASPLAELPVQYADYAAWQREFLQGTVLETQLGYWKRALADLPELDLPADRPRPAVASHRGESTGFVFDADLARALQDLGRREGATLFMTLLASFQVLLCRWTGQADVAVGVPIAGRTRQELDGLLGCFVNTLVLRGDLSGAPGFRDYLAQVRERALDAYAHQDLPFEKLVEELAPKRDLSRNPLVQVSFNLVNAPRAALELDGVTVERLPQSHTSVKFDLSLRVEEIAGRLHAAFEYSTDLFDASTIERLAAHWRTLLEGIVADPEMAISRLPLLTPGERHRALTAWNATAQDYPRDACLHTLFEAAAARTPDAVAVVFMDRQLTYGELNARANRLAHHLRGLGVGPEVRVAVAMERSLELVVALLGVLKAGGAYVPLDPDHPPQRLAFMLEDTQPIALLTQRHLLGSMPPLRCRVLCLDADGSSIGAQPETNPACAAAATSLAYLVYTSGSTGEPKGVLIEHREACSHLHGFARAHAVSRDDRVLQTAPLGFDMSLWQLLLPLLSGGTARPPRARSASIRRRARRVDPARGGHHSADGTHDAVGRREHAGIRPVQLVAPGNQRRRGSRPGARAPVSCAFERRAVQRLRPHRDDVLHHALDMPSRRDSLADPGRAADRKRARLSSGRSWRTGADRSVRRRAHWRRRRGARLPESPRSRRHFLCRRPVRAHAGCADVQDGGHRAPLAGRQHRPPGPPGSPGQSARLSVSSPARSKRRWRGSRRCGRRWSCCARMCRGKSGWSPTCVPVTMSSRRPTCAPSPGRACPTPWCPPRSCCCRSCR